MMESALFFSCSSLVRSLWSTMSLLSSFQSQLQASWILLHHKARSWGWSCTSAAMEPKIGWGESITLSRGAPWGIGLPTAAHWGHLQPWPWLFTPLSPHGRRNPAGMSSNGTSTREWSYDLRGAPDSQVGKVPPAALRATAAILLQLTNGTLWLFDIPRCPVKQQNC